MAKAAHSKEGETAECALTRGEVEGPVLVVGNGLCPDINPDRIGQLGYGIAIGGKIGGAVILIVQWAFDGGFEPAESVHLYRCLVATAVAAAEANVEDRRGGVAVFGGEGAREEVGVFEDVCIEG